MARQRPTRLIMGPCIVEIYRIVIRYAILGRPRVGNGAMHNVQYQFEVSRCRNEEFIVKGNFGWAWSMWAGAPQVEIDCIVMKKFKMKKFFIVKGNFGWAWSMWAWRPRVGNQAMHINRCRNEQVNFQGSIARMDGRTDGRTDSGDNHNIPTLFKKPGIIFKLVQDIIGIILLTKFHEDQTINVASRVKNALPLGSHTNLMTKFHEDWTINVSSRELTRQMLTPHNAQHTMDDARQTKGDHKSSPCSVSNSAEISLGHVLTKKTASPYTIRTNVLTKPHEDWTKKSTNNPIPKWPFAHLRHKLTCLCHKEVMTRIHFLPPSMK
ncbi:hypothetical protein DPMN_177920 [Dreissena polymorpha]|uniref:Uncharacterized protein n=1 Tax=Dreissena polymorpha TaxID=45954 RepID=A0A9D4IKN5_DREPO|nr:hypothetical protein DPMN_177920 [Dreissena polymorpha]